MAGKKMATRKKRRMIVVLVSVTLLIFSGILVLFAFEENIVFFRSPSDISQGNIEPDRRFRLGGLVEDNSVQRLADGVTTEFRITDMSSAVTVQYRGLLPDLFREGQGVVCEGRLNAAGLFVADEVLAKHDENYMPPEVAEALKKSGKWQGDES